MKKKLDVIVLYLRIACEVLAILFDRLHSSLTANSAKLPRDINGVIDYTHYDYLLYLGFAFFILVLVLSLLYIVVVIEKVKKGEIIDLKKNTILAIIVMLIDWINAAFMINALYFYTSYGFKFMLVVLITNLVVKFIYLKKPELKTL